MLRRIGATARTICPMPAKGLISSLVAIGPLSQVPSAICRHGDRCRRSVVCPCLQVLYCRRRGIPSTVAGADAPAVARLSVFIFFSACGWRCCRLAGLQACRRWKGSLFAEFDCLGDVCA